MTGQKGQQLEHAGARLLTRH